MNAKRIGILVCDEISEPLAARHGQYLDMFKRLLTAGGARCEVVGYRVHADEFPPSVESCDAYIVSGSRRSVYEDEPWIRRLADFLRELRAARRRTVGICFGHQMIGHTFGGRTEKAAQGWGLGRHAAELLATKAWMQPPCAGYALYVVHQDQVVALPPDAEHLATSAHCENAMFVLDDLLLGIQAHPEFELGYARALAENKRGAAPDAVVEQALEGFGAPVDAALMARWITRFLGADGGDATR